MFVGTQIQASLFQVFGRPSREAKPLLLSRVVNERLILRGLALPFEKMSEERSFHFALVKIGYIFAEGNLANFGVSMFERPIAMAPRTHHQRVERVWILIFDVPVNVQRPIKVLRIKQATDGHHIGRDVFQVRYDRSVLPE